MSPEPAEPASERLGRVLALLPEVTLGILFGSRARGRARADSDFDIGILLDAETAAAERGATIRALAGRLGREVSSAHLDIVILNDAPALLRHRVLRDGIVLFQRSAQARVRFATRTIRDYQDGFHRRREFTRRRIERVRGSATSDGGPGDLLEKARVAARLLAEAEGLP